MMLDVLPPSTTILPEILGGLAGVGIGWFVKKKSLRWAIFFALLGMLNTIVLLGLENAREIVVYSWDIQVFVPLFALLGGIGGAIYNRLTDSNQWQWLPIFMFFGALIGALSQVRGNIIWLIIGGTLLGATGWYIGNSRLNWTVALASLGTLFSLSILPGSSNEEISVVIMASLGALLGWFINNDDFRWLTAFLLLGAFTGTMYESFSFWNNTYLLIGGIIGGIAGYFLSFLSFRRLLAFSYFGFFLLSFLRLRWLMLQILNIFF